jgi:hypothetical protein
LKAVQVDGSGHFSPENKRNCAPGLIPASDSRRAEHNPKQADLGMTLRPIFEESAGELCEGTAGFPLTFAEYADTNLGGVQWAMQGNHTVLVGGPLGRWV